MFWEKFIFEMNLMPEQNHSIGKNLFISVRSDDKF